jgi:hypothetical protein
MSRLKPNASLVFSAIFGILIVLEIGWLRREHERAERAIAALNGAKKERDRLVHLSPGPNAANEAALDAAVGEAERMLVRLRTELGVSEPKATTPAPVAPVDAYFELCDFVERTRLRMSTAAIGIGPAERFGFTAYANAGPATEIASTIHRQREAIAHLMEIMLAVRPIAFLGIKRAKAESIPGGKMSSASDDYFIMPQPVSIVRSGLIDADAFRLQFSGHTAELRAVLNRLVAGERPLIVRAVEIEPVSREPGASHAAKSDHVIIEPNASKFTLTLEIPRVADKSGVEL